MENQSVVEPQTTLKTEAEAEVSTVTPVLSDISPNNDTNKTQVDMDIEEKPAVEIYTQTGYVYQNPISYTYQNPTDYMYQCPTGYVYQCPPDYLYQYSADPLYKCTVSDVYQGPCNYTHQSTAGSTFRGQASNVINGPTHSDYIGAASNNFKGPPYNNYRHPAFTNYRHPPYNDYRPKAFHNYRRPTYNNYRQRTYSNYRRPASNNFRHPAYNNYRCPPFNNYRVYNPGPKKYTWKNNTQTIHTEQKGTDANIKSENRSAIETNAQAVNEKTNMITLLKEKIAMLDLRARSDGKKETKSYPNAQDEKPKDQDIAPRLIKPGQVTPSVALIQMQEDLDKKRLEWHEEKSLLLESLRKAKKALDEKNRETTKSREELMKKIMSLDNQIENIQKKPKKLTMKKLFLQLLKRTGET